MERIAGGELSGQFVVVRQVSTIVLAQGAKALGIGGWDRMAGQSEAIHFESAVRLLVNIKVALIPGWREVVRPHSWLMEEMPRSAIKKRKDDGGIVTGVDLVAREFCRS